MDTRRLAVLVLPKNHAKHTIARYVVMKIADAKTRSRRVAERLGLACEGTCSQSEWLYDHYVNQVIYAVVADQWFAERGRIYGSA